MNKVPNRRTETMRKEYDFSKGIVGKYARRFAAGTNIVLIDPDLIGEFPDSKSVNTALRDLVSKRGGKQGRVGGSRPAGKSS